MMRYAAAAAAISLFAPGLVFAESEALEAKVVVQQSDLPSCATATDAAQLDKISLRVNNSCADAIRIVKAAGCSNCSDQDLTVGTSSSGDYVLMDAFPSEVGSKDYSLEWSSLTASTATAASGTIDVLVDVTPVDNDDGGGCTCLAQKPSPPASGFLAGLALVGFVWFSRRRR